MIRVADPEMIKLLTITGLDRFLALETPSGTGRRRGLAGDPVDDQRRPAS